MKNRLFQNKNCLITGATGGLGESIAKLLAKQGSNIFLTSRRQKKLQELKKEIDSISDSNKIFCEPCDLSKLNEINKLVRIIRKKCNSIDILINSAGIFLIKPLSESTVEEFDQCFNVNIRAPFLLCKEFSKDMIKKKWGRIINIGSSSSYAGFKNGSIYCASKHSLLGFSRALYNELKEYNIRTFCVSPGSLKTKMGKLSKDQNFETFLNPDEVADYILFVISFDKEMMSEEVRLNRIKNE